MRVVDKGDTERSLLMKVMLLMKMTLLMMIEEEEGLQKSGLLGDL